MKLFYVEHTVVTTGKFALIARDQEHLDELLAKRKEAFEAAAQFSSKQPRDKKGNLVPGTELSSDWPDVPSGQAWDGRA